ncbi:diacylglycerol O-acyltransferase 1 [Polyrhizophydium stewartii]|uniref:diacylglycerol O-acyltransferase n=1 Tax=Polyrhizophydium stewartii TaxID=2732419 RepID=A0ABR4NDX9_9FUNG
MDLVLEKRKGFVRLALTTGASLLPVIGFGENELYERLRHPLFDPLHKAAYYTARMAAPLFVGRFMTPIPFRTPLTTVFGPPIYVDKVETPTCEQVDALHKQYLAALQRLYDQHKDEFHAHRRQEMRFVA